MAEAAARAEPDETANRAKTEPVELELSVVLAAAALILSAFPIVALRFSDRPGPYLVQTFVFWSDLPLMALGVLRLPDLVRWVRARRLDLVTAMVVLVGALTVGWAFHPSIRGALQVLRFLGIAAAVLVAARGTPVARRLLAGTLVAFTVFQVVLAVAQRVTEGPVGLRSLGEMAEPLVPIGGDLAPQGTLIHPYLLAGLAMVTIAVLAAVILRNPPLTRMGAAFVAVSGVAVGLTYSRTAAVAVAALVIALVVAVVASRARSAALIVLAAVVLGVGVTSLVASDGWVGRAKETSTGTNVTRGRGELAEQALALIRSHPLVGVGTGRYVLAVEEDEEVAGRSSRVLQPVHTVPLLLVAEGGIPAAAALIFLAVVLAVAARRAGVAGWVLVLAYLPFLLLDHFPATFPQGLAITAAWLMTLQVMSGDRIPEIQPQKAPTTGT